MAESTAMSERILVTIDNIIKNDLEIQDFTIVPSEGNTKNKSPVLYEQHNIGLESWCVRHVYNYACKFLFDHRELLSKKNLSYSKMEKLNYLLNGALLVNPDVGTFWNMKRELTELDVLNIDKEFYFSKIVLTYKSKSNEAFSYRRWLLKRLIQKLSANELQTPVRILQHEFMVVNMASEKSPNNYHSWNHRIWCMENIASSCPEISNIVYSELAYSQEWINNHISEHAGYHYRQYLIKLVKEHKNIVCLYDSFFNFVIKQLNVMNDGEYSNLLTYLLGKQNKLRLLEETYSYINYVSILLYDLLILIDKLNKLFPEHESLFYHRKFVVFHLLKLVHDYHGNEFQASNNITNLDAVSNKNIVCSDIIVSVKGTNIDRETNNDQCPKLFKVQLNRAEMCNLYKIISNSEKQFVYESSNSCSAVQIEFAKRYKKWLKYVIGFD